MISRDSIATRLNIRFLFIVTALMAVFGTYNYQTTRAAYEQQLKEQQMGLVARLQTSLPNPLWNFDAKQVEKTLDAEMASPLVEAILISSGDKFVAGRIRDASGAPIVARRESSPSGEKSGLELQFDDNGQMKPVATIAYYLSAQQMNRALNQEMLRQVFQTIVLDVILILCLGASLQSVVIRPLQRVRDALQQIASGDADLTRRLDTTGKDEIGELAKWFNVFVERLQGVVANIAESSRRLLTEADAMAQGVKAVAAGSQEQSEIIAAMAAAMEEMTVGIGHVTAHSGDVRGASNQSGDLAQQGNAAVDSLIRGMQRTAESVNSSAQSVGDLGRESEKINAIVNTIKEIADQTNLLALNAAIEAARAGESGRGFAVVADEVKKLAERTSRSAGEITEMIGVVQRGIRLAVERMQGGVATVSQGLKEADHAASTMASLEQCSTRVVASINDIVAAIGEQNSASTDIARRVESIARLADESSASMKASANSAAQVHQLADRLKTVVASFKV